MMAEERDPPRSAIEAFERALEETGDQHYVLRLYVTGSTARSLRAIENLKQICEEHLQGRYELEVFDVYQHPTLTKGEQIVALPTLVKQLPAPIRRMVGDLSDTEKVLLGLDVKPKE